MTCQVLAFLRGVGTESFSHRHMPQTHGTSFEGRFPVHRSGFISLQLTGDTDAVSPKTALSSTVEFSTTSDLGPPWLVLTQPSWEPTFSRQAGWRNSPRTPSY